MNSDNERFEEESTEFSHSIFRLMGSQAGLDSDIRFRDSGSRFVSEDETINKKDREDLEKGVFRFDKTPEQVSQYLDRFVIGQEEAKKVLSIAICDHYYHVKRVWNDRGKDHYFKQNVLLVGPTGVGKTYLIQCLADLVGVPFVKSDATKFSETGYVGGDVEDLVRQLVKKANGNVRLAELGIIYLDEVDKISGKSVSDGGGGNRDVGGRGVQSNLLKLLEDTEVPVRSPWDIQSQLRDVMMPQRKEEETINTRHILFIMSGVFDGLLGLVKSRTRGAYGFGGQSGGLRAVSDATTEDFVRYGLESEFAGRLPVRAFCHGLSEDDLATILIESEGSLWAQYQRSFLDYGIFVEVTRDGLGFLAKQAYTEKTGARGLMTVFERAFRLLKYRLPSTSIRRVLVDREFLVDPQVGLDRMVRDPEGTEKRYFDFKLDCYEAAFLDSNRFTIRIHPDVRRSMVEKAMEDHQDIVTVCDERLRFLDQGINLLRARPPAEELCITPEVFANPHAFLEKWIRKSFDVAAS